jgi:hypothetical protein
MKFLLLPLLVSAFIYGPDRINKKKLLPAADDTLTCNNQLYFLNYSDTSISVRHGSNTMVQVARTRRCITYKINGVAADDRPRMLCDTSAGSPYKGRVYIYWTDQKYGENNEDIFLAYSDDQARTWTEPVLVTYRPNHKPQFMATMKVGLEGSLDLCYYNMQNSPDGTFYNITLARSVNGGLKFDYFEIATQAASPAKGYSHIALKDTLNGLCISWGEKNMRRTTYVQLSNPAVVSNKGIELYGPYSFEDKIQIRFRLTRGAKVSAAITKPLEPAFEKIVFRNKKYHGGDNSFVTDTKKLHLGRGNYVLTLYADSTSRFTWITAE